MQKAAGVGLNLQEASKVFLWTMNWTPAVDDQAIARGLRAGSSGVREVVFPDYNIFFGHHYLAVQKEKRAWDAFFWDRGDSGTAQRLNRWLALLDAHCNHLFLNQTKSVESATVRKEGVQALITSLQAEITEKEVMAIVEAVTPSPFRLIINDWTIIPVPGPGSQESTVQFATSIQKAMKQRPEIHEALRDVDRTLRQNPVLREKIRSGEMSLSSLSEHLGILWKEQEGDTARASMRIEFFKQGHRDTLERYQVHNPDGQKVIRLYLKERNGKQHFDLVLKRP